VVSNKGIDVKEHKQNRIKDGVTFGNIPIDFISYGVQDMKFWKVFTFIVVNELSSRTKKMECHAYLCDSSASARKMALLYVKCNARHVCTKLRQHRTVACWSTCRYIISNFNNHPPPPL
jgi:hypothetical protein